MRSWWATSAPRSPPSRAFDGGAGAGRWRRSGQSPEEPPSGPLAAPRRDDRDRLLVLWGTPWALMSSEDAISTPTRGVD
jgi:hypothetical protein